LNLCEIPATLAQRGNPGYDMTLGGVRFSLKTQANKGLSSRYLHISKFMELGGGTWTDQEEDFMGLREQFFRHMESYDRILFVSFTPNGALKRAYQRTIPCCHDSIRRQVLSIDLLGNP
jgi:hypothetical protein